VRRPHGIPGESIYDEGVKFWPFPQASQGAKRQAKVSLKILLQAGRCVKIQSMKFSTKIAPLPQDFCKKVALSRYPKNT
jgi:hypothetical protein